MMVTMMMMMATMITMNDADDVDDDDDETGFQCSGHLRTQAQWGEDPGCCLSIYSGSFLPPIHHHPGQQNHQNDHHPCHQDHFHQNRHNSPAFSTRAAHK